MTPRRVFACQRGYTLAEMLVAAAVIGLVLAGLLSLLMSGQQAFVTGSNRTEAVSSSRIVLFRMAEEVRTGGYDPRNTASFAAITPLNPPNVGFTIGNDWNATGAIESNLLVNVNGTNRGEQITYSVVGTALRRQESVVDGAAVEITNTLNNIVITYLNADDVDVTATAHQATTAPTIRTVVVTVTTNPDVQESGTVTDVALTSTIRARVRNRS
ncbi:MAG: prepilin-type N-terminal cleavage/methylation domain-containing protein [Candidatus Rokubacteria bacterium]|nr:prepilin-type N-terminal cleavage/methylation domain-containing protein [Candidatus Rokubacteria bacterium]